MEKVAKIVNMIIARSVLIHRRFKTVLDENESKYGDMLFGVTLYIALYNFWWYTIISATTTTTFDAICINQTRLNERRKFNNGDSLILFNYATIFLIKHVLLFTKNVSK